MIDEIKPPLGTLQERHGEYVGCYLNRTVVSNSLPRVLGYLRTIQLGEMGLMAIEAVEQARREYNWPEDATIQVTWGQAPKIVASTVQAPQHDGHYGDPWEGQQ